MKKRIALTEMDDEELLHYLLSAHHYYKFLDERMDDAADKSYGDFRRALDEMTHRLKQYQSYPAEVWP